MSDAKNGERLTPFYWERQDNETDAAYAAFAVYRDLGPSRTKVQAYRDRYDKPEATQASGTFSEWARRYEWDDRARQFDLHNRRQEIQAFLGLSLNEHLDALRSDAVQFADMELRAARELGEALLLQVKQWIEQARKPGFVASASDIRAIGTLWRDLIEHGMNTKGAAVGVHQLVGLLTGETPLELGTHGGAQQRADVGPSGTQGGHSGTQAGAGSPGPSLPPSPALA